MDPVKTGSFIAELRKEKEMTQLQLAAVLNVSDKAVSRWETGRGMPDINSLEDISSALGVSVAELLRGERLGDTVPKDETEEIASEGFSLAREHVRRRKYLNILLGSMCALFIATLLVMFITSPIYLSSPPEGLSIEQLSDGRLLAVFPDSIAGYDIDRTHAEPEVGPGASPLLDISLTCYDTLWHRIRGESRSSAVILGDRSEIAYVRYYPTKDGDVTLYRSPDITESWGKVTLPRLVYNTWSFLGIFVVFAVAVLEHALRRSGRRSGPPTLIIWPLSMTLASILVIAVSRGEIYDAPFYTAGMTLLALIIGTILTVVMKLLGDKKRAGASGSGGTEISP